MSINRNVRDGPNPQRGIKTTSCKRQDLAYLFPRDIELTGDFLHRRPSLKILKHGGHRHSGIAKHPAPLSWPGTLSTAGH